MPSSSVAHSTDEEPGANGIDIQSQSQNISNVHKVGVPPKQNFFKEFCTTVKETFFADDPLRQFKDQKRSRKLMLCLQAVFPIFRWGREYNLKAFRGDLIAGLTIASLCIPQDIGYAKLANLDPQYGLYSSFVPPLIYAVMGTSREIAIGPVAVVSLMLGTLLQNEVDHTTNPDDYLRLAFTATFFAGITQFTLGVFRLGFLIDFLSHAAIVGLMGGAAITIALQQLKGFLGIKKFTKQSDIVSVMDSVWSSVHHGWNWQTTAIGASFLTFLIICKYIGKKNKKYFWVPAMAPLISVILSTFFVFITRADEDGVQIVKHIEKGINPSSVHKLFFRGDYVLKGARVGIVVGMVALTEAVAIGRTFASMKDYQLDGNKEMVALGAMNIVGSMTSCYVTTGGFARTAVNRMAGCHTTVSNIIMSSVVFLTLLFITPLFKYTPNAVLSSIIISVILGLIDYKAAILIWKTDKFDFVACMGAFFGVVFVSAEVGLLIAVLISFAKILLQVTRPGTAVLGKLPGTSVYRNMQQYPEATAVPGILIVRVDSAIYFSNSNYIKDRKRTNSTKSTSSLLKARVLRWLTDTEEEAKAAHQPRIEFLIVDMSPVTEIDTSGIHALEELYRSLQKRDVQLALSNPGSVVMNKLHASGFNLLLGDDKVFLTVGEAVSSKLIDQNVV